MQRTVTTLEIPPFARRPVRILSATSGITFFQLHARAFPVRRHQGATCQAFEVGTGRAALQRAQEELTAQHHEGGQQRSGNRRFRPW
jgi:hypothetical protein